MPGLGSQLDKIGTAMAGFSAGLQGQLPQFQQVQNQRIQQEQQTAMLQQEQRAKMVEERQKTMYTDAAAAQQLAKMGRWDDVVKLGINRLQGLQQLSQQFPDIDPSDTQRLTQLAVAARNGDDEAKELFMAEVEGAVITGQALGILEAPEVPKGATDLGKLTQDYRAGLITQEEYDAAKEGAGDTTAMQTLRQRWAATGKPAEGPEYEAFMLQGGSDAGSSEREKRIQEYMRNFNLTEAQAISRLDAQYMTDPVTGNLIAVDRATGTGTLPRVDVGEAPAPTPAPMQVTEADLAFDPAEGTGFGAAFLGAYNSTLGQIPLLPVFQAPETAAQQLRILERDAINALATSSRPAVVEQERILAAIPKAMEWTQNPEVARYQMTSFINLMTNQYVDDLRYADNRNNPRDLREEAARRSNEVERIINRVLTPEAAKGMFDSIRQVETEISEVQTMPITELRALDPANLTDAQLDLYIDRLQRGE